QERHVLATWMAEGGGWIEVVGEEGVGKSRLARQAMVEWHQADTRRRIHAVDLTGVQDLEVIVARVGAVLGHPAPLASLDPLQAIVHAARDLPETLILLDGCDAVGRGVAMALRAW